MNKIYLSIMVVLIGLITLSYAQAPQPFLLDEKTKELCNHVILNIYHDIDQVKDKYTELAQFGEGALYKNQYGIYAIVYEFKPADRKLKRHPYEFGITITNIDDTIFQDKGPYAFNLAFPLLKLKFAGYQKRSLARYRYDIGEPINMHGILLADHQQTYMPLRLSLQAHKSQYFVNEDVTFDVVLQNVGNSHMYVKSINPLSLYCLYDDRKWGTNEIIKIPEKEFILKSKEKVKTTLIGENFPKSKDVEIYCSYNMSIEGVKPSGILRLKVVPQSK